MIRTVKLEAQQIFIWNFKGTPSQEEHKTIFSGVKIYEITLSDQIDFPGIFQSLEDDFPEFHQFRNTKICCRLSPVRRPYTAIFKKIDYPELADCGKSMYHRECSGLMKIVP
jgi:hypothetical protein